MANKRGIDMNKKIYLTQDYKRTFIDYYNNDFCKRFDLHKINTNKLEKLFDYALTKGTWRNFAGNSVIFGERMGCGTSMIFLTDGEIITGYNNIIKHEENYYNTDKDNFMLDIMHELACEIERCERCLKENNYTNTVNRTIKKILTEVE